MVKRLGDLVFGTVLLTAYLTGLAALVLFLIRVLRAMLMGV